MGHCIVVSHHRPSLSRCHRSSDVIVGSSSIVVSCRQSLYIVIASWVIIVSSLAGRQVILESSSVISHHPLLVVGSLSVSPSLLSGHHPGQVVIAVVGHSMVVSHRSLLFEKRNCKMGTYPRSLWTVNHRCQLSSLKLVRKGMRPRGHHCQRRLQDRRCAMGSCNPHGGPASWRGFRGRCANKDGVDTEVSVPTRSEGIQRSVVTIHPIFRLDLPLVP